MKYMTAAQALMEEILKLLKLSEILPVYLVERLYLAAVVTGNKYCIYGRVQGTEED